MNGIVDFHSHILPAIDDGSSSPKESVAMLQMEKSQGIEYVVATPHFYPRNDTPKQFLNRRKQAEEWLRTSIRGNTDLPQLIVGAEVHFFPGISESDAVSELTIGGKRYILIEMIKAPWTDSMFRELEDLYIRRDIVPIIAHIDRYISPLQTYGISKRLSDLPVLVQANASFFLRRSTRAMALRMLKNDQIHLLGSDCHNLSTRPPNLGDALDVISNCLGREALDRVCEYQNLVLTANE